MNNEALTNILSRRFSINDLHTIAIDCGWPVEDIGTNHHVKSTFLRNLIQYAQRRSQLPKLLAMAAKNNSVLVYEDGVLYEKGGDTVNTIVTEIVSQPDPKELKRQEVLNLLKGVSGYNNDEANIAFREALLFLVENTT